MKLTQADVDRIEPVAGKRIATGVPQMYIFTGKRFHTYRLVYERGGVQRKLKIGDTRSTTLAQAAKQASQELAKLTLGKDPAIERAAKRQATATATFGQLVPKFINSKRTGNKPRAGATIRDYERYLADYARTLHKRPVAEIKRAEIADLIDKVKREHSPTVALLMARNLSSFFSWCERSGLVEHSPARNVEKPDAPAPRKRHLSPEELGAVWNAVKDSHDDWGRIIGLLLLTGARLREMAELMWSEVDLDAGAINFDPLRIKTRNQHRLPITNEICRILAVGDRQAGYVFGRGEWRPFQGFTKAQAALLDRLQPMPRWTPHDLRRTFQTRMAEEGLVEERVLNSILNHTIQGVKRHYDYAQFMEQKRAAMDAWAAYVEKHASDVSLASKGQAA